MSSATLPGKDSGRSPFAGLDELDRPTLYLLGVFSALKAAALVGLASALASGIVGVIEKRPDWAFVIGVGVSSALLRSLVVWGHRVVSSRALLGRKERLRASLADALLQPGADDAEAGGSVTVLATRGLDELDKYYTVFLPALVSAATIPLIVGVRILFADWLSALIVVLTVPLIPVFMALIGMHTRERVRAATDSLSRLSDHLVELARGLPVLVGLGRAREQTAALGRISEEYRDRTVQTLRTAFLSSLALELIATISVAVVAVFIGVRLVAGQMPLEIGLLALLLAPECFAPFRDIGTAFHASEDGREALRRVRAIIGAPRGSAVPTAAGRSVVIDQLTVRFEGRSRVAVDDLSFTASPGEFVLLDGESGSGKSTVFGILTGRIAKSREQVEGATTVSGSVSGIPSGSVAYLPQHPHLLDCTVREELERYAGTTATENPRLIDDILERLGLSSRGDSDGATISPGELRRLGFARVLVRVATGATVVLLDEPTAQLDDANAAIILHEILSLPRRTTVIVASHDPAVQRLADRRVLVGHVPSQLSALERSAVAVQATDSGRAESAMPSSSAATPRHPAPARSTLAEVIRFLRPQAGRVLGAILLGTLATLFVVSLTALSGWLIVRASQQPPIMYLLVAIVGVRFFGIGRAVLRYAERLVSHNAVFAATSVLRMRLWASLSASGLRARTRLQAGQSLDLLINDVDQVRDLSIRVVMPAITGLLASVVTVIGLGIIAPNLLPLFVTLALVGIVIAPLIALLADRSAARTQQEIRSRVLRRFAAVIGAREDLRANGVDEAVRSELRDWDARASRTARRGALALGLGSAVTVFACCAAAILVLPLSAAAVSSGSLRPELVAVLALTPLGLIDPLLELLAAVQNYPCLRRAVSRIGELADAPAEPIASADEQRQTADRVDSFSLEGITARWPGATEPVFAGVSATVNRGEWLVVTGPSGTGKSTLLALLLGQLDPSEGRYRLNGSEVLTAPDRRIGWCPQEGHLFNSSLRANLLLARSRAEAPDDDELREVLMRVGLGPLLSRLTRGLDTGIGSGGAELSGGERQRVAVARTLLTGADVILLDEPTAHLDSEAATALMADLRSALTDRITVLVTHQGIDISEDDLRIDLSRTHPISPVAPTAIPRVSVGAAA